MTYASDKDKDFSTGIKSGGKRCFKCDGPVYFTSEHAETPSGKPTRNPLTGKVVPLDPSTHEYHECKPEDVETYRETDDTRKGYLNGSLNREAPRTSEIPVSPKIPMLYHPVMTPQATTIVTTTLP